MGNYLNAHIPTSEMRQRVSDLTCAGIPLYLIADILDLDDETVAKHYRKELKTAQADLVDRISRTVARQALEGDSKAQSLYLKTQGAKFGFVEKHVVENHDNNEVAELKAKIDSLQAQHEKEF